MKKASLTCVPKIWKGMVGDCQFFSQGEPNLWIIFGFPSTSSPSPFICLEAYGAALQ